MSTVKKDVILVDYIETVLNATAIEVGLAINYEPGRWYQILKELQQLDDSITLKPDKFPLFAMQMPVVENRGQGTYATVKIPRIVIAYLTKSGDDSESVMTKYDSAGIFKTILYPIYYAFLNQLARSGNFEPNDCDYIIHRKMDNPSQSVGDGATNDYVDSIEILDLELTLIQIKNCK